VGRIKVHEFITLDGVIEDPRWTFDYDFDPKMAQAIGDLTAAADGILLGRRTFEMFAPAWKDRTAEDDPGAPFFNDTQKYVVSGTLESAAGWQNSTIVGAYDAQTLRDLKEGMDGDLYVSGSGVLVRGMLADGLVDEVHLFVFPLTLGAGQRLFGEGDELKLAPVETEAYDSGVVHLAYGPAE